MEKGNRGTMKTSVDAVSGVERKITVEIPAEEVDRRIEREFAELRRSVPLRGFRKGKAPMEMVKRMFRTSVEAEVSERLGRGGLTRRGGKGEGPEGPFPSGRGRREDPPGAGLRLFGHGRGDPRGRAGRL